MENIQQLENREPIGGGECDYPVWPESCGRGNRIKRINTAQQAHYIVQRGIKYGRIIKPRTCSKCGIKKTVYAHHSNYSKPLEVSWLCGSCHYRLHRNNPKIVGGTTVSVDDDILEWIRKCIEHHNKSTGKRPSVSFIANKLMRYGVDYYAKNKKP